METTRHFTATMFVVVDGTTVLHEHDRLGLWLPPGGHVRRDELPHRAAVREAREEIGLDVALVQRKTGPRSETSRPLPQPVTILLEDINVQADGRVGHQHIDFIYYGVAECRTLAPRGDEPAEADAWQWFTTEELREDERFDPDVRELAIDAIDTAMAIDT